MPERDDTTAADRPRRLGRQVALELIWPVELAPEVRAAVEADVGGHDFTRVTGYGDAGVALLHADGLVIWHGPGRFARHALEDLGVARPWRRWRISVRDPAEDWGEADDAGGKVSTGTAFEVDEAFAQRVGKLKADRERSTSTATAWSRSLALSPGASIAGSDAGPRRPASPPRPASDGRDVDVKRRLADLSARTPNANVEQPSDRKETAVVASVLSPCGYVRIADGRLVPARVPASAAPAVIGTVVLVSRDRADRLVAIPMSSTTSHTTTGALS